MKFFVTRTRSFMDEDKCPCAGAKRESCLRKELAYEAWNRRAKP